MNPKKLSLVTALYKGWIILPSLIIVGFNTTTLSKPRLFLCSKIPSFLNAIMIQLLIGEH